MGVEFDTGIFGDIGTPFACTPSGCDGAVDLIPVVSLRSTTGYNLAAPQAQLDWEGQIANLQTTTAILPVQPKTPVIGRWQKQSGFL